MPLHYLWSDPPAPGTVLTVAPGLSWLRMPLPFQLDHVNLWLLEDGAGWTVVDTGVGLEETQALWERIFATVLDGRPITRVVVTHFHPDHMGNAAWLVERWGVELWCTQAEWFAAQWAWRSRGERDREAHLAHYRRHGVGDQALAGLRRRGNHYPSLVPGVPLAFRCLHEGDHLAIGAHGWQVRLAHGHAPEQACLWSAGAGVLISGDQVLPRITSNVSVWASEPRENPLRLYLESLERFRAVAPQTLVLPSHGLPFRGLHARLAELADHHAARLGETLDALHEPRTAAEVVPAIFRRALDIHQLSFALGEALAHLNFLEAEGRVVRTIGADGVHRFQKA